MKGTELSWQLAVGQLGQGSKRENRALAIIPSYSNNVILPILSHRTIAPPDLLQFDHSRGLIFYWVRKLQRP